MKISFFITLLIFIASNIYWIHKNSGNDELINILNNSLEKSIMNLTDAQIHKENRLYELEFNGKKINKDSVNIIDIEGNTKSLDEVVKGNKLILRYSSLNCQVCIEEQIKNLNAYCDSIGVQNILLFTTYDNINYMRSFRKANQIKFPIYRLDKEAESIFEDIGAPYLFVLNENIYQIQNMFLPLKEIPTWTDRYLSLVNQIYFSSEV